MILPLRYYREFGWIKTFGVLAKSVFYHLIPLNSRSGKLRSSLGEPLSPPRLKLNDKGQSQCVSCFLCAKICPSGAIELQVDDTVQFPKSLLSGPAPKVFAIDADLCLRCSLCVEICPVQALAACGR